MILPAILLLPASCASVPTQESSRQGLESLLRNTELRSAVAGQVLLTSELEGRSVTAPAVLLVEWPGRLRLELQDPVGGLLALLVLNGGRFWLYESSRPEILTGPVEKMPFGMIPRFQGDLLVRLLLARPSAGPMRQGRIVGDVLKFHEAEVTQALRWSGSAPEPEEWRLVLPGGHKAGAVYSGYEFKGGLRYPTRIRLESMAVGVPARRVLVHWKEWEAGAPKEKKLFEIPQQQAFGRKIKALP